jgi:hypothetical protein
MRPIVNLGRSSHMSFPASKTPGGAWRQRRARRIHLNFRPVNFYLQSLHKVNPLLPYCNSQTDRSSLCLHPEYV